MTNGSLSASGSRTAVSCPNDERLIAYLTTALTLDEQRTIDKHVDLCDPCVETLLTIQSRLHAMTKGGLAVPQLRQNAAAAMLVDAKIPAIVRTARPSRWATLLRLPILMPLSMAAGALLMISAQNWRASTPPQILTRGIQMRQTLPVTAATAVVHTEPDAAATVIAKLTHGDAVEIGGEEREWYRITLPNGREGWVEQHAFE